MNGRFHTFAADVLSRRRDVSGARTLHDLITIVMTLGPIVFSAGVVAAIAALVDSFWHWAWYVWATISPLLYLGWLVSFLSVSAWICRQAGRRNPKPRYAVVGPGLERGSKEVLGMLTAAMCYRRAAVLQSTPFVSLLSQFRPFDRLVLRAYSPSVHVGRNGVNWAAISDPDLTEIGDDVVLGGRSSVDAHSLVIRPDGSLVYASAPVRIGNRSTVGAGAHVPLGCVIGDDAIVEPGAVLEAFTRIPAGEIWGGNPARFRRRRDDVELGGVRPDAVSTEPAPRAGGRPRREDIRALVVETLGLLSAEAQGELSSETCSQWDSLGQVAIAAAIYDRYAVAVEGPEIFALKSVDDIATAIAAATESSLSAPDPEATALPDDAELLPLLEPQAATRALAAALAATPADGVGVEVTIAASFTTQALEPPLKLWGRAFGLEVDCRHADYAQIVQALLAPARSAVEDGDSVTVVLTRPEDLPADPVDATAALDQMLDAVERAASSRPPRRRLLVGTLPPVVSTFGSLGADEAEALRHRWRTRLATIPGIEVFDFSQVVERIGLENARSSETEALTRGGYSQRLLQELAIALVRRLRAPYAPAAKVVALDCDNTLWGGVVGEVGLAGLELGPDGSGRSFQLFQRYLKRLKDRGLLLVVVSRNEERDVREVFADHPGMVLRAEDIAAWRVNWAHKSENLVELADELNLGLDSFVFLDDDPVTRMEVKSRAPAVHVVPLPDNPSKYCETLERLWLFDGAQATAVDATRTEKAQEEARRRDERSTAASLEEFLESLQLEVELRDASDADWQRVAQLTQRTNQFNLSLKRRTLEEVEALARQSTILVLAARDRFGDYGQIGVCVLEAGADSTRSYVDSLLMSCRALGRGVEDAFLHAIASVAAEQGAATLVASYREGPRNGQVKPFLARTGFEEVEPDLWQLSIQSLPPLPRHVRFHDSRRATHPALERVREGGTSPAAARS